MIKFYGISLIILSCMAFSQKTIIKSKASIDALNSLISALREMADSISFFKMPLPEIMRALTENEHDVFFRSVLRHLSNDNISSVPSAWEMALKEDLPIPQNAKNSLALLGKNLGKQTAEREKRNIDYCLSELEGILNENEKAFRKNTKMIKSFGLLSGLVIVILFV